MGLIKSKGEESLSQSLQICDSCNRVSRGGGSWSPLGKMYIPIGTKVAHGFCLDCCAKRNRSFPEIKHLLTDKSR